MMKNINFLAFITIITLLYGCQKGITDEITSTTSKSALNLVKTYTEDLTSPSIGHLVTTYNLSYDANGRIVSMVSASSPGDRLIYQYNPNNTFTFELYNANVLDIHGLYFINSMSLIDSSFSYNSTFDTTTEKYTYNAAKQLISVKEYDYKVSTGSVLSNTTKFIYDGNGNVISEQDNFKLTKYDYYTNLLNDVNVGQLYVTKNTNLTKTTMATSGGTTDTLHHTYTFDGSNRLSTEKVTASDGGVLVRTYTY